MAIDFPNSPTVGQVFTSGDKSWIWDGTVWKAYGASLSPTVLKVDSTNSRVGINNQSPAHALDVVGRVEARAASTQDGVALVGRAGGTSSYDVTLTPTTLTADRTLTLPDQTGTVAVTTDAGLQFITSQTVGAVASISFNNCFSSTFENYRIICSGLKHGTGDANVFIRFRASSTDTSTGYYWARLTNSYAGTATNFNGSNVAQFSTGFLLSNGVSSSAAFDVFNPQQAIETSFSNFRGDTRTGGSAGFTTGFQNSTTQFDGITIFPESGSFASAGTIRIYGYKN